MSCAGPRPERLPDAKTGGGYRVYDVTTDAVRF